MLQIRMVQDNRMLQVLLDEIREVKQNQSKNFKSLTKRMDIIGKNTAFLEDDTATREEHYNLEERVTKLEKQVSLN